MSHLNPAHIAAIKDIFNSSEFNQMLSIEVTDIREKASTVVLHRGTRHNNFFGGVHGGMYATLIDTACYWASYGCVPEELGMTTIDLYVNDVAMSSGTLLTANANVIKAGRSLIIAEANITDEDGKLLASGVSKLMTLQRKQTLEDAIRYTHSKFSEGFPRKFIEN